MSEWDDRVEAVYVPAHALQTFRTESSTAARISPGESFHVIEVDHRWLIDWYQVLSVGVALFGPPFASLVAPISHDEYVEAVRLHLLADDWLEGPMTHDDQVYAVLSMCRGLRTWRTGEHVSKREAARWACEQLPDFADLIGDAVNARAGRHIRARRVDGASTDEETRRFVSAVQALVG